MDHRKEHDFSGSGGACTGCGRYVEECMEYRYCTPKPPPLTVGQIKHMVDRFLGWKLPDTFSPDNGISFDKAVPHPQSPPVGTNLFDATQAEAMVRHMIDGLPGPLVRDRDHPEDCLCSDCD